MTPSPACCLPWASASRILSASSLGTLNRAVATPVFAAFCPKLSSGVLFGFISTSLPPWALVEVHFSMAALSTCSPGVPSIVCRLVQELRHNHISLLSISVRVRICFVVRVMSERLSEAEARSRKREILMAYPAATVRIEKTDESGRAK